MNEAQGSVGGRHGARCCDRGANILRQDWAYTVPSVKRSSQAGGPGLAAGKAAPKPMAVVPPTRQYPPPLGASIGSHGWQEQAPTPTQKGAFQALDVLHSAPHQCTSSVPN